MSPSDIAGVVGVALMVIAYAGAQIEKLEPRAAPALLMNLIGSGLVIVSLTHDFNLSAMIMEGIWALVAAYGLAKLTLRRFRG